MKGFTLIELLVVIMIIGVLLTTILAVVLNKDGKKSEISCDYYRSTPIKDVPARCASYFNIKP